MQRARSDGTIILAVGSFLWSLGAMSHGTHDREPLPAQVARQHWRKVKDRIASVFSMAVLLRS